MTSSLVNDSNLEIIEEEKPNKIKETNLYNDRANGHTEDDDSKVVVSLQVPERTQSGNFSLSSGGSGHSNITNKPEMRSAKWFFRHQERGRNNTGSTQRSRTTSGASKMSQEEVKDGKLSRRKSVMHGIIKRGRTMRKTMRAMQINEAESLEDGGSGRGHALTTEQRLRMYVLKEIADTEEDYTKLLQFIIDVMIPSLNKCAKDDDIDCITSNTVSSMLSNIVEIHRLHIRFSASLKEATHPFPYYTNCIGHIFLKYREEFRVYAKYCMNFSNAQKLSYKLEEDKNVQKLVDEWKESVASKTRKFLHLEGFIISPVQRLCKYPLLLRELKKFTNDQHPDAEAVAEAMTMMEEVTTAVNESERRAIAMQAIRDLEDACDSWEKSGCMSKQGFMTKRGGTVKTWNIRWFTLSGYKMRYFQEPTDVKPLGVLDLTSYKDIEEDAAHTGRPFAFGIKMPDRVYYMYAISERERQEWLAILKWKFGCIDRSRRQAHRPLETVIFASLSSFLNPKDQKTRFRDEQPPIGEKQLTVPTEAPQAKKINKNRSKSFFRLSFRSSRRSKATSLSSGSPDE